MTSRRFDDRTNERLWLLVGPVVIGSLGALFFALFVLPRPEQNVSTTFLFATLLVTAQALRVHLRVGASHLQLSPTSAAALITTAFLPAAWAMLATAAGMLVVTTVVDRQKPIKIGFNVGKETLAVGAAALASALAGARPEFVAAPEEFATRVLGLAAATIAYGVVDEMLSVSLFALLTDSPIRRLALAHLDVTLLSRMVSFAVVVLCLWAYSLRPWLVVSLPFLVYALHLASANQLRGRLERRAWQRLAQATDELNTVDLERVVTTAIHHACHLFAAEEADLSLSLPSVSPRLVRGNQAGITYDGPVDEAPKTSGFMVPAFVRGGHTDVGRLFLRFSHPVKLSDREFYTLRTFATALNTAIRNAATFAETRLLAERHQREANEDRLTLLANRSGLQTHGASLLADGPGQRDVALLLIDLNRFKDVNETLGHMSGDKLLVEVAHRLRSSAEPSDLVARLGGDEFAVLFTLPSTSLPAYPVTKARAILAVLDTPIELHGMTIGIEASAGVATWAPSDGHISIDELLRRADVAMYEAKHSRQQVVVYSPTANTTSVGSLSLGGDLAQAISDRQFVPDFQPIVDLGSGQVIAAEALARWHHPARGILRPDQFLDGIERSGQLSAFSSAVLDQTLEAVREWDARGFPLDVAVNVCPRSLLDSSFPSDVLGALSSHAVHPSSLIIELTESLILSRNPVVDDILAILRSSGIRLALDDFGTGFSSLSTVTRVPVYELKIDRSFVSDMNSPAAGAVVRSTIELGRHLGVVVVAEGVETEQQRQWLWELGCPAGQGYLFARPMASAALLSLMESGPGGQRGSLVRPIQGSASVIRMNRARRFRGDQCFRDTSG